MNTPQWMIEASTGAPSRAKSARHNRRSTDRPGLNIALAAAAMLVTLWCIFELNALLLH